MQGSESETPCASMLPCNPKVTKGTQKQKQTIWLKNIQFLFNHGTIVLCLCVCAYGHMRIQMHTCACMLACMYASVCACVFCVCVCMNMHASVTYVKKGWSTLYNVSSTGLPCRLHTQDYHLMHWLKKNIKKLEKFSLPFLLWKYAALRWILCRQFYYNKEYYIICTDDINTQAR